MSTHAYCPTCKQESAIDREKRCLWCEGPTEPSRGGWKRPDLRGSKYTEPQLRAMHVAHEKGVSVNALAKQTYERVGYKSHHSAVAAITREWKRLGLPYRTRQEARILSNKQRARPDSPRRRGVPRNSVVYRQWKVKNRVPTHGRKCAAVRNQYPRKGAPCKRPPLPDSDYCWSHDPRNRERGLEILREARRAAGLDGADSPHR